MGKPDSQHIWMAKPCYLLSEGYAKSFKELMETTDWNAYGTGKYEKCADCMVHCGYEATAVADTLANPFKALLVWIKGVNTEKSMAPEISLKNQRPAEFIFEDVIQTVSERMATQKQRNDAA